MLPRVIIHNAVSADGRLDFLNIDLGLFYGLAARFQEDATLAGSDTILAATANVPAPAESAAGATATTAETPPRSDVEAGVETPLPSDTATPADRAAPLLVVPDSRGRIRSWDYLRAQPYWRDVVVLCSLTTTREYLDSLHDLGVEHIVVGDDHVDLRLALEKLKARFGVNVTRVDSGGTLNGVLLRQGLVDEISLLIHPSLVGGLSPRSYYRAPDLATSDGVIPLRLFHFERLEGDLAWLRYEVVR